VLKIFKNLVSRIKQMSSTEASEYQDTIDFVNACLTKVESGTRVLPKAIHDYEGFSGAYTREFYNAICSRPNTSYLEIGTWYGSSSISALYNNTVQATFIDNWSQFAGNKQILINALEQYKGKSTYTLVERNCFDVSPSELSKYDVYMYDGDHTYDAHYKAITRFYSCLKDGAIVMIDDWTWPVVRQATHDAIRDLNIKIVFSKEIILSQDDVVNMPKHKGRHTWWNGIGIFVVSKK
jgi:hypothetical protein